MIKTEIADLFYISNIISPMDIWTVIAVAIAIDAYISTCLGKSNWNLER